MPKAFYESLVVALSECSHNASSVHSVSLAGPLEGIDPRTDTARVLAFSIGASAVQLASNLPLWDATRSILRRNSDGAVGETSPAALLCIRLRGGRTG